MDTKKRIAEIEMLERILLLPDSRPLRRADKTAANRNDVDAYADDPWFWLEGGTTAKLVAHILRTRRRDSQNE